MINRKGGAANRVVLRHAHLHDIRASAVLLTGLVRTPRIRIGVVANRVGRSMPVY